MVIISTKHVKLAHFIADGNSMSYPKHKNII